MLKFEKIVLLSNHKVLMSKKVNLKTIAQDLGLSPGTVSRVLNGKAKKFRISDETVELVKKYAQKKGYAPNLVARGLRDSKTYTIGLMIPDIANPFFSLMAKNIEKAASGDNYSILLVDAEENIEKEKLQLKNMANRNVDGIIASPVGTLYEHFLEIAKLNIPLIFVDRYFDEVGIPFVTSDNFQGGFDATTLLIKNGHEKIALITGNTSTEPIKERKHGYIKALEAVNININENFIIGDEFSFECGYKSTKKLLSLNERPTAIFALSNLIGLGAMQALKENNLIIPNDISLIVFDDQPYASILNPPITTVKQNSEKIGELAIKYILSTIKVKDYKQESEKLATKIIERDSILKIN